MNTFKKIFVSLAVISCILVTNTVCASAEEVINDQMVKDLVEAGYTQETAEALPPSDIEYVYDSICNDTLVGVSTCSLEIDNLDEIEDYLSYNHNELLDMGFTENEISKTDKQISEIVSMTDAEMKSQYGMDAVEVKMLRKAVCNGNENRENGIVEQKDIKNKVSASGSISSSKMTYTQSVSKNDKNKPNYTVKLSYTWKSVYALAIFKDKIVAAWGGALNTKNEKGTAKYYDWQEIGGKFKSHAKDKSMSVTVSPNKGVIFEFPQSINNGFFKSKAKTKTGSASFTLYQKKAKGYDTTLISNYCHRVISVKSPSISISASGATASISIGGAWDKTSQKRTTIGY